jgi:hypothetical protein
MPLTGENNVYGVSRQDHPLPESALPTANLRNITPDYFAAMQIPLVAGEDFDMIDRFRFAKARNPPTMSKRYAVHIRVGLPRRFSELAVFDACLYIRVRRIDKPA